MQMTLQRLVVWCSVRLKRVYHWVPIGFVIKWKIRNKLLKFNGIRNLNDYFNNISHHILPLKEEIYQRHIKNLLESSGQVGQNVDYAFPSSDFLDARKLDLRAIAFYLPQFHPIAENDQWWGKGFTEWVNVTKAVPQFLGHYQPHLPGELGFYDLRLPQVMRQQIDLAKQYGIYGFCFYYYWFNGKKLLENPVNKFLADDTLDIQFCLCWANENWTRRWDGKEEDVLLAQQHTAKDDLDFIDAMADAFADRRYIRIDNKPLLIIYRAMLLPDPAATAQRWRDHIKSLGFSDLYLVAVLFYDFPDDHVALGFDAVVEFPPHRFDFFDVSSQCSIINPNYTGHIYSYQKIVESYKPQHHPDLVKFRSIMPSWDNEARRPGAGVSFVGANPKLYTHWLKKVCQATFLQRPQERLFFINAWNEWAEGAHLEPDRKFGYGYLQATANVLSDYYHDPEATAFIEKVNKNFRKTSAVVFILHCYYDDLINPIFQSYLTAQCGHADLLVTVKQNVRLSSLQAMEQFFPNIYFIPHRNCGRDMAPFLVALSKLVDLGYKYACKLHTKKSLYRNDGGRLRRVLLDGLLGNVDQVQQVVQLFSDDPQLGILVPKQQILSLQHQPFHLGNLFWLDKLLTRMGCVDLIGHYTTDFPAGSMYWFRTQALEGLEKLLLPEDSFEEEVGQLDGTLAHALERIIALFAARCGYQMKAIDN